MDHSLTQDEKRHFIRRLKVLEAERKRGWESHWKELSRNFLPRRARFLDAGEPTNEDHRRNDLQDGIGIMALRTLANGMQSGLTSPARPWFSLTLSDADLAETQEARLWLHDTYEKMVGVFRKSNFYDQIHVLYSELACFGTAVILIEEDMANVMRCRTMTVGEYSLDVSESGRVDTLYRRIRMTARQVVEAWPESVPERVRHKADNDSSEWITILHAIEPNKKHKPGSVRGKERPFRSVYMILEGDSAQTVLEDSGYYEFPALCPRWTVTGSDVYGSSPAMDALPDNRQLQKITEDSRMALEKEVNPPLLVSGSYDEDVNASPGGLNFQNALTGGEPSIRPMYEVRSNLQGAERVRAELKEQIRMHFFNDLFLMLSGLNKQMTATEVAERNAEKMLMLGPVLDRLRSEIFQPLIERLFGIMERRGMVADPPASLAGVEIAVEFISILAQAQKLAGIGAISQTFGFMAQMAGMDPGITAKFNFDEALDAWAEMQGTPPKLIRSSEEAAAIREQQAQAAQQQQAMEAMREGAAAAKDGAAAVNDLGMRDALGQALGQAMGGVTASGGMA